MDFYFSGLLQSSTAQVLSHLTTKCKAVTEAPQNKQD